MDWLDRLVGDYPGGVLVLLVLAQIFFGWTLSGLKWFVKREFAEMEDHQERQDVAIESIESRLNAYDITFAVSRTAFEELIRKIDAHIKKEDDLPLKVQQIADDIGWIKEEMFRNGSK
jgi:hypothetical protein